MKDLTYQLYGKDQAALVIAALFEDSRWFQVEPWPCDQYLIAVKPEPPSLPAPWGTDGTLPLWESESEDPAKDEGGRASSPASLGERS